MNISCEIIEDLLPLYNDQVCSEKTKQLVTEHLSCCTHCQKLIQNVSIDPILPIKEDGNAADKAIKRRFHKLRSRWWITLICILILIPICMLGWNEYTARGISFSNPDALILSNAFMKDIVNGDYEQAFRHIDIEAKRQEWLDRWFDEAKLVNLEADALAKFCELGKIVDTLGGINDYEYLSISRISHTSHGDPIYMVVYNIDFQGKQSLFTVNVSSSGISDFFGGSGHVDDPLSKFTNWSEQLWQDYSGCYYDSESNTYIYYDQE